MASERRRGLAQLWWSSLPLRVLITMLVSTITVLLVAGLLLLHQATKGVVETKREASITQASGVLSFMQDQLRLPDSQSLAVSEQLGRLADTASAQAAQYKVFIQGPASLIGSAGVSPTSVPDAMRSSVQDGEGIFVTPTEVLYTDGTPSDPGWVVGSTLVDSAGERFPVYYIFPMTSEVRTLDAIRGAVLSTGGALLVAMGILTYIVTVQVMRPVRRASRTAQRLAAGNLDERLPVRGTDDIASLALSMNGMANDLQGRIRELEALSSVQRRFVSDVSHELRTPLTTIKMASDLLYDQRADAPATARTVELMSSEIDRFDDMLSDLLEISRFDAGAIILSLDEVDMSKLVSSEVDAVQDLATIQSTELRFHGTRGATAKVDARRIRRILRNLLTNAIEHGEGRPIDVRVAVDDEAVAVTVRDRGVGFEANQTAQVFERFWRADPARARMVGGSGLGLAIALEDARLHRGWLTAWGRPGRGAQFRLTLPKDPSINLTSSPLPVIPTDVDARRLKR